MLSSNQAVFNITAFSISIFNFHGAVCQLHFAEHGSIRYFDALR